MPLVLASVVMADVKPPVNTNSDADQARGDRRAREIDDLRMEAEQRIPLPVPRRIKVLRGQTATFEVRTIEDPAAQRVDFIVRDEPKHGEVSRFRPATGTLARAEISYTPDVNSGASVDFITFAARYPNGRYSAPTQVEFQIATPQPVLELPPNIHFGRIMIGQAGRQTIPITNVGNAPYEKPLEFEEGSPWTWAPEPGETKLRLEPDEQKMVTLKFEPSEPGMRTYRLSVTPGFEDATAQLTGQGVIPFHLTPERLVLTYDPDTRMRSGVLRIEPRSPDEYLLSIKADERLKNAIGERLLLAPGGVREITLYLPPEDPLEFSGSVVVSTPGYSLESEIQAEPAPAYLTVELDNRVGSILDFGDVEPGSEAILELGLRNWGGVDAFARCQLPEPFEAEGAGEVIRVAANSEHRLRVWFRPDERRPYRESVNLAIGENEQLLVTLRANGGPERVAPPSASVGGGTDPGRPVPPNGGIGGPNPSPSPRPIGGGGSPSSRPSGPVGAGGKKSYNDIFTNIAAPPTLEQLQDHESLFQDLPTLVSGEYGQMALPPMLTRDRLLAHSPFKTKTDIRLPQIPRFTISQTTPKSIELIWMRPDEHEEFEVETRITRFNQEKKRFEAIWIPCPEVHYKVKDFAARAEVKALQPASYYHFRVFSKGEGGTNSLPSEEFGAYTKAPPRRLDLFVYLSVGGIVLSAFTVFFLYMRRTGLL